MDLRSIINNEAADSLAQRQATPITPIAIAQAQRGIREYHPPPPPAAGAGQAQSHEYGTRGSEPYASPTSYQRVYQARPSAPTPLQTPAPKGRQSPGGSAHYSTPSAYHRHATSMSGSQYPFPPSQSPHSPAHPQLYPNTSQHRDSYPQTHPPPQQAHQHNPYGQPSPVPITPPVATPGGGNHYIHHQRSQSTQSNSTPTSAHSQQPYYGQYLQDSPVSGTSFPPTQLPQHQRQQSHPGTPLGPPISNPRSNFPQPASPYQQRPPSSGLVNQPLANPHSATPPSLHSQTFRQSESPNHHNSSHVSITDSSRSQSARERSLSVSPKTQLPGLPRVEMATNQLPPVENGHSTTVKRKIDDRESSEPAPPQQPNGMPSAPPISLQQQPARKRIRYTEPPIWARSFTGRVKNHSALLGTKRPANGKQVERLSQAQSTNGHQLSAAVVHTKPSTATHGDLRGEGPLGPWEPSIAGITPYEEVSKIVADWLFMKVVNRPDAGELASRGVEIEIEAKLGQLINKDTNERFWLPVQSECILADNGRVSFRSSMTEAQHKALNEFLNAKVEESHPDNPNRTKPRVQVLYSHRRERDRFYELPPAAHSTLPACIRSELNPRHTIKVRVTHDQKTGQLLAKIIKARVADLDLYNPRFPLDCRISVNLEMKYEGDVESLIASSEGSRMPDRNKDRLSYTQSHYQIDLTQVTVADAGSRSEKEHELEIEISAAAVREQGRRAAAQEPHQYGDLIEGFMNNVRVLTRTVPLA